MIFDKHDHVVYVTHRLNSEIQNALVSKRRGPNRIGGKGRGGGPDYPVSHQFLT